MKDQEPHFGHAVFEILLDNQEKLNMDLELSESSSVQTADSNEAHWHRHESKITRLDEVMRVGIDIKGNTRPKDTPSQGLEMRANPQTGLKLKTRKIEKSYKCGS